MNAQDIPETSQYLSFKLDEEIYAFSINQVREVLDFTKVTKVPRMPAFMRGVINLRGGVVPVVDLRLKFDMDMTEKTVDTCIIIIEIDIEGETTILGTMADSVLEVMTLESKDIEPPPKLGTRVKADFIKGMGKKDEEFIILLDNDKVFSLEELDVVHHSDVSPENIQETGLAGTVETSSAPEPAV